MRNRTARLIATIGPVGLVAALLHGQSASSDGLWQAIAGPADRLRAFAADVPQTAPAQLSAFRLQTEQHLRTLSRATPELNDNSPTITMPMQDGSYLDFRVQETEVMPRELAQSRTHATDLRG